MNRYSETVRRLTGVALALAAGLAAIPAECAQTEIWTMTSRQDFQKGESKPVALTSTGEITLPLATESVLKLSDQDAQVWALAEDAQGNVYAGTGEQGKIFKIAPDGKTSVFFDSPEVSILSLAVDAQGNIYAGTAPDGLIYKLTPDGAAQTFFMTGEHYVWSLAFGADQTLYAGSGETGKIFKILPDGSGAALYDSPQTHVMAVLFDPQGWLYAVTEGKGVAYKVDLDGHAFGLFHAKEEEIHALARDAEGNLYFAALSSVVFPKAPAAAKEEEPQIAVVGKTPKRSVIYRFSPDGTLTTLAELDDLLVYTLIADGASLLAGTDQKGAVLRIDANGDFRQQIKSDAQQIIALFRSKAGALYMGTGESGAVLRVAGRPVEKAEYLSVAHDAATTATWGNIFWRGTPGVTLMTRTGNTETPDDTWSQWSAELRNAAQEPIANPAARFIQWKAILTAQGEQAPVLEDVSVAYLPNNLAPQFKALLIASPTEPQEPKTSGSGARANGAKNGAKRPIKSEGDDSTISGLTAPEAVPMGKIAVLWSASDPNGDSLTHTVSIRGEGEGVWMELEDELSASTYILDSAALADGEYIVKITASDSPDNPPARALHAEKISERLTVDNTSPMVSISQNAAQDGGAVSVTVSAQDATSRLLRAEYALDGGEWLAIFPEDGVSDSKQETYALTLPDLAEGAHVLTFKVTDQAYNAGFAKLPCSVPASGAAGQ